MGMKVVVLTGSGGGLAGMADCALQVPSINTQRIQETHLLLEHLLCLLSERYLA
jgi:D-sedoheptulose 7-phosphate isomerase